MSDSHWEQVKDIFQAALERSPGAERERYLRAACGARAELRDEVLVLLDSFEEADDFLDASPVSAVAEEIVGASESLAAGQQIGRYRIEKKLGAGGMGEVYLARDTELERPVALKILAAAFSDNPDRARRFAQEAKAASALNHPNILTIYETGQFEDWRFIATEYVAGETLRERLRRQPLDLKEIRDVFGQTAAALEAAHSAGIIHRDIKPENIMIRPDNLVKVLDFGLAKLQEGEKGRKGDEEMRSALSEDSPSPFLPFSPSPFLPFSLSPLLKTTPGLVMGTVAYMSPEQARGLATDARTDVWSLGVCLYETVFGAPPFAGDTASDQIAEILKSDVRFEIDDTPPGLRRIIEKCLEKKVENRYQTIKEFSLDLKNLSEELKLDAEPKFTFAAERRSNGRAATGRRAAISTQSSFNAPRASSAEYVVGEIKKHKAFTLAASIIAAAALGLILYLTIFHSYFFPKPINSIAVLSFVNESGDAGGEHLSDGLSESLINKFSELPQLKVASRSSAFKYKGENIDPAAVAGALGVEAIIVGRVARRGDDLQISVELIDTARNAQLWGKSYRRKISDAQAVEEEIASAVLQKLQIELSGAQQQRLAAPITQNAQAYQLYLNGVYFRRKNGTGNLRKAIEYQNQAINLDPNFALAYVELGHDHYNLVAVGAVDPQTGTPLARVAVEKALSLDDSLAEARDLSGSLKILDFDWMGAENEIRRAIELNPNLAAAHTNYAVFLSQTGRVDEALREIKLAQRLDPPRIGLIGIEGSILYNARRYDEALAIFERDDPDMSDTPFPYIVLARAYIVKNRFADAINALRQSLAIEETTTALIHLGRAHALAGERDEALKILERLKKIDRYVSPAELSTFYAALGMREQAFKSLEQAFAARDFQLTSLRVEPEYDALRDDPRFQDLLRRINFSQ